MMKKRIYTLALCLSLMGMASTASAMVSAYFLKPKEVKSYLYKKLRKYSTQLAPEKKASFRQTIKGADDIPSLSQVYKNIRKEAGRSEKQSTQAFIRSKIDRYELKTSIGERIGVKKEVLREGDNTWLSGYFTMIERSNRMDEFLVQVRALRYRERLSKSLPSQ